MSNALIAAVYNEVRKGSGSSPQRKLIFRRTLTATQTLTLPAGRYVIEAVGNGGAGGRSANNAIGRATGGGGPAVAKDWGTVTADHSVTVTIGARAVGTLGTTGTQTGANGGAVDITGPSITAINLTGGQGGVAAQVSTAALLGGLGGVATGGKWRRNGGRGGDIPAGGGSTFHVATGGGAANLFSLDTAPHGGDISAAPTANAGTGGAGVGGDGGATTSGSTAGGGAGSGANAGTPGLSIAMGTAVPDNFLVADILTMWPGLLPTGPGASVSTTAPAPGGGAAGSISTSAPLSAPLGAGGGVGQNSGAVIAGSSDVGGGGGGAAGPTAGTTNGSGGAARVIISVYADMN